MVGMEADQEAGTGNLVAVFSTTSLHAVSASFTTPICLAIFAHLRPLLSALHWNTGQVSPELKHVTE